MDKFDETIKNARETHEPSEYFVDNTMEAVGSQRPVKKNIRSMRLWAPITAGAVVVIALVFVLLPSGKTNAPGDTTGVAATNSASDTAEPAAAPAGTSNASLASDLSDVQNAMKQENTDQTSANTALNDQQQEITVPTD